MHVFSKQRFEMYKTIHRIIKEANYIEIQLSKYVNTILFIVIYVLFY